MINYGLPEWREKNHQSCSYVDSEQDLGIWCTANLKPFLQCQLHAVSKAMKALGLINIKYFKITYIFLQIIQYLRLSPFRVLLYVHMWSPFLAGYIDTLEKVRHRATKLKPTIANLSYEQRLKILNLKSLYAQQLQGN